MAVFASAWHGASKENKLQLELLSKQRPWQGCDKVYAIRGPPIAQEMMVWEALNHVGSISERLMNTITTKHDTDCGSSKHGYPL